MLALGFSSGLPFMLVGNTFGYWLRDEHISLAAIGFISALNTAYSLKFLWSPFMDRVHAPLLGGLGRRRGWMIIAQIFVAAGLGTMALVSTAYGLAILTGAALVAAFASASQDIVIDAWRIESARDADELGLLTSAAAFGYRVALLAADSFILIMAQHLGWSFSYFLFAALMAVGVVATLFATESAQADAVMARKEYEAPLWTPRGLFDAIVGPFIAFFKAHGLMALVMLVAISLFQVPNFVIGPMYGPLYDDLGLTKDIVGGVRLPPVWLASFLGVVAGGYLSLRLGYMRAVIIGGAALIFGTALYAVLPLPQFACIRRRHGAGQFRHRDRRRHPGRLHVQPDQPGLYRHAICTFTSTYAWAGKLLKGFSGATVEGLAAHFGLMNAYALFFLGAARFGIPALLAVLVPGGAQQRPG